MRGQRSAVHTKQSEIRSSRITCKGGRSPWSQKAESTKMIHEQGTEITYTTVIKRLSRMKVWWELKKKRTIKKEERWCMAEKEIKSLNTREIAQKSAQKKRRLPVISVLACSLRVTVWVQDRRQSNDCRETYKKMTSYDGKARNNILSSTTRSNHSERRGYKTKLGETAPVPCPYPDLSAYESTQ